MPNDLVATLPLLALLIAMGLLVRLMNAPVVKGFIAELIVNVLLHLKLPRDEYTIYWNVTLPTPDGTTQIDHIVVSPYGIFVIETKAYGGWIFGDRRQKQWTQTFSVKNTDSKTRCIKTISILRRCKR